jgi:hypothetical protein
VQAAGRRVAADKLLEPGSEDRHFAAFEPRDLLASLSTQVTLMPNSANRAGDGPT